MDVLSFLQKKADAATDLETFSVYRNIIQEYYAVGHDRCLHYIQLELNAIPEGKNVWLRKLLEDAIKKF